MQILMAFVAKFFFTAKKTVTKLLKNGIRMMIQFAKSDKSVFQSK
jgi:hypothetical protein